METTAPAPLTGVETIDAALAGLADLDGLPLAEQYAQLRTAQSVLAEALDSEVAETDPMEPTG